MEACKVLWRHRPLIWPGSKTPYAKNGRQRPNNRRSFQSISAPPAPYNAERSAKASARGRSPSTSVHHLAFFVLTTFTGYYYNCQTLSGTKKIIPQRCQRIRRSPNAGSIEQHRLHRVSVGGTYPTAAPLRNNFSKVVPDAGH